MIPLKKKKFNIQNKISFHIFTIYKKSGFFFRTKKIIFFILSKLALQAADTLIYTVLDPFLLKGKV